MTEMKAKRTTKTKASTSTSTSAPVEAAPAGQRVGYVRVSTAEQNTARQLEGVEGLRRIFEDRASGKDTARPALAELLKYVREGDTVVVHSLDRLGRNLDDLRGLVAQLTGKGVRVEFLKESLTFAPGGASPMSDLLLSVLGAFAQFERALILERQREGIAQAKKEGKYKGRGMKLSPAQAAELRERAAAGENRSALAREFGISRNALYEYLGGGRRRQVVAPAAPVAPPAPAPVPVAAPVKVAAAPRRGAVPASLRRILAALKASGTVAQWDSQLARWVAGEEVAQRAQLEKLVALGELVREGEGGAAIYRRA